MNDAKKNFLAGLFNVAPHEVEGLVGKLKDALGHEGGSDTTSVEPRVSALETDVAELRKTIDDLTAPEQSNAA
ncbi:hypothetical protein [Methylobacterium sp.]|jgi:uncharacterized protein YceH (UPF0502 family)|uniref:hypothetical protein n=1 Tax=Methylobacterium sp. TaxID=409 RepID=UPI000C48232F|nr:hypothetical protein [Methylobacterium sp.]MBP27870.1 hypothetical protein [Methylobacterium sp.]